MKFSIPCELTITPGSDTMQVRFRLSVNGETVFDDYEQALAEHQVAVCKEIAF